MTTPRFRSSSRHRLAPVGVVTFMAALCLSFGAVSSAATSPQAQVRAAWTTFKNAIVDKSPTAFCASLTSHASAQFIADVPKKLHVTSCKAAAVQLFKVAGGASEAHIRLLSVRVKGNTATTTDTAGPPAAHWVRTGGSTWKIATFPSTI
jgi:hypothetical protein